MTEKRSRIATERLVLRLFDENDARSGIKLLMNEEVSKTYMIPELKSAEEAGELFRRIAESGREIDRIEYGIYRDGALIGFINDCGIDEDTVELGYVIDPAHKGNGYATEALSAVIGEVFRMGYRRVVCGYFDGNDASRRVMEKCGMIPLSQEDEIEYRGIVHRCLYCYIDK